MRLWKNSSDKGKVVMVETVRWTDSRALAVVNDQARAYLVDRGIPSETLLFVACAAGAEPYVTGSGQKLLYIGDFDEDFRFFVDVNTGSIYFGLDGDESPAFSNVSLAAFVACILWVEDKFPFYAFGDSIEMKRAAGQMAANSLRDIDPIALDVEGGFWSSFVHDVAIGDYYEGSL
jgi:hypothetical protein